MFRNQPCWSQDTPRGPRALNVAWHQHRVTSFNKLTCQQVEIQSSHPSLSAQPPPALAPCLSQNSQLLTFCSFRGCRLRSYSPPLRFHAEPIPCVGSICLCSTAATSQCKGTISFLIETTVLQQPIVGTNVGHFSFFCRFPNLQMDIVKTPIV